MTIELNLLITSYLTHQGVPAPGAAFKLVGLWLLLNWCLSAWIKKSTQDIFRFCGKGGPKIEPPPRSAAPGGAGGGVAANRSSGSIHSQNDFC